MFQTVHEVWLHVLKEIQIKGHLLTSISLCERFHVKKLGYMVEFQEAVHSSNAVSSTLMFPKVSSSHAME